MQYVDTFRRLSSCRVVMAVIVFCSVLFSTAPVMAEKLEATGQENSASDIIRSTGNYNIPSTVEVVRMDGKTVAFVKEIDDGRPVIMNFIFASCSAICPMLSHVFSQVQTKFEKDKTKFHLVSMSIDPENDTPAQLVEYAKKFKAGKDWDFYTGSLSSSIALQKACNVFRGDKMNHASVILMRSAPGKPWLRLEGFVSPEQIIDEFVKYK